MSLIETLLSRRSIRRYEQKEIPKPVLDKILEAARQAPSASNRQPYHLIALTDNNTKKALSTGQWNTFIKDSPTTIVGCANMNPEDAKWSTVDTTIALQNLVLAAWALGIGSCWIGDFKEDEVKQLLKIPPNWKVIALITLGYPAEQPHQRRKKPLDTLVSHNTF